MYTLFWHIKNRYLSQKAQGMLEYALILIFVAAIAAVALGDNGLGQTIKGLFSSASDGANTASNAAKGQAN